MSVLRQTAGTHHLGQVCKKMDAHLLLSAFLNTSTRRVKLSPAGPQPQPQGLRSCQCRKLLSQSQRSGEGEGRDFLLSFPGSSASLGIQLHAIEVTLDPSPSTRRPSLAQPVKTLLLVLGCWESGISYCLTSFPPTISCIPFSA